jgi:phosphopantothenoylcysteine synthetase/decarboxylase
MNILITSGGTKIQIDKVRHIANMSSGTFGAKIATEALKSGHQVTLFKKEGSKTPFSLLLDFFKQSSSEIAENISDLSNILQYRNRYKEANFSDFNSYESGLCALISSEKFDVVILAAAVSDYGIDNYVDGKIRSSDDMSIKLKSLPKIINRIKKEWGFQGKLVGFKLLVDSSEEELVIAANKSIKDNDCDIVVANDLQDIKNNNHKLTLVFKTGVVVSHEQLEEPENKNLLAEKIIKYL